MNIDDRGTDLVERCRAALLPPLAAASPEQVARYVELVEHEAFYASERRRAMDKLPGITGEAIAVEIRHLELSLRIRTGQSKRAAT